MEAKLGKKKHWKRIASCLENKEILIFPEGSENQQRWSVEEQIE